MNVQSHLVTIPTVNGELFGIRIHGATSSARRPTHFVLLLDTSDSMSTEYRLESVKQCVKYMLNFMSADDLLTIVRFSDDASIIVNAAVTTVGSRAVIEGQIDSLKAAGSTNVSAGLLKVREVLSTTIPATSATMKVGLVILTDGHVNVGICDETRLSSIVGKIRTEHPNVSVSCVGYGRDHQASLLQKIAIEGGGCYNIVTSPEHVGPVFGEILGGLLSCVAQNVTIEFPSTWESCSSYVVTETSSNSKSTFVGDIYSESEVIVLLKTNNTGGSVTLRGFNCIQTEDIVLSLGVGPDATSADLLSYKMCYIRGALSKILVKALAHNANRANLRSDLDTLESILQNIDETDPMVTLLRTEFTNIRKMLKDNAPYMDADSHVHSIQRSAFLGTGRGATTAAAQDPDGVMSSIAMNVTQRNISAAMTTPVPQHTRGAHAPVARGTPILRRQLHNLHLT